MINEDIDFLYKYFPLQEDNQDHLSRVISVLEKNELYFSRLKDFNDPYDCRPIWVAPPDDFPNWLHYLTKNTNHTTTQLMEVRNAWQEKKNFPDGFVREIESKMELHINEELGICCFSKKPDNLLMWAHYASLHTGVCFEFGRNAFLS